MEYYLQIPGGGVDRKKEKRRDKVFEGRAGTGEPAERAGGGGRAKLVRAPRASGWKKLEGEAREGADSRHFAPFPINSDAYCMGCLQNVAHLGVIMWHFLGLSMSVGVYTGWNRPENCETGVKRDATVATARLASCICLQERNGQDEIM